MRPFPREPDRLAFSAAFFFLLLSAVAAAVQEGQATELLAMLAYLSLLLGIAFVVVRIRFVDTTGAP